MSEEITKHTLNLRAGDYDKLKEIFPEVGAASVIRGLVSRYVDSLQPSINPDEIPETGVDL